MSEIIICEQNSKMPKNLIESLNFNQAGMGRHKCVLCAYQNGVKDGEVKALDFAKDDEIEECQHGREALKSSIENIHENQKLKLTIRCKTSCLCKWKIRRIKIN